MGKRGTGTGMGSGGSGLGKAPVGARYALVNLPNVVFYMCVLCNALWSFSAKGFDSPNTLIRVVKKKTASAYRLCEKKLSAFVTSPITVQSHVAAWVVAVSVEKCGEELCIVDAETLRRRVDCLCAEYKALEEALKV